MQIQHFPFLEKSKHLFLQKYSFFFDNTLKKNKTLKFPANSCSVRTFLIILSSGQLLMFLLVTNGLLLEPLAELKSCKDPQRVPAVCALEAHWSRKSATLNWQHMLHSICCTSSTGSTVYNCTPWTNYSLHFLRCVAEGIQKLGTGNTCTCTCCT